MSKGASQATGLSQQAADAEWLRDWLSDKRDDFRTETIDRIERIANRLCSPSPDGEVTEEMIEAGARALYTMERDKLPPGVDRNQVSVEPKLLVSAIFKAMISARSGG